MGINADETVKIGRRETDRIPRWFLNLIFGVFGTCSAILVSVLLYIFTTVTGRVEANEMSIKTHESRIQKLEVAIPLELKQVREDVERTRKLVEAMALKQGVIAP